MKKLIFVASFLVLTLFVVLQLTFKTHAAILTDGSKIEGIVKFPEEYPETEKITITKDQAVCGAFQYSELFVVSEENHGLQNVVITLLDVDGEIKAGDVTVTLDQNKCTYIPHVQAAPVGTTLEILNSDGILHNVHAYFDGLDPNDTVFNKAQPKFLKKITQKLDKAGMYYFKCDVHDHMSAYIASVDHPYYAVTDESGKFTISNVPPGTYKIRAWHEVLGALEKEVTVIDGKSASVTFDILPNE